MFVRGTSTIPPAERTGQGDISDSDIIMNIGMPNLKLVAVGTSTGAILPKEMLAHLKVRKGDSLFAIETPEGYFLTPYDPAVEEQLKAGRVFMKRYRDTFKALAK